MIKLKSKLHFLLLLLFLAGVMNAQNSIDVKFIGNCGLYLSDGVTHIYTDFPYESGAYGYMTYEPTAINEIRKNAFFIFTHKHADHFSRKVFRKIVKETEGKKFTQWKGRRLLRTTQAMANIEVQIFKTKHRFSVKHNSYLITWNGKRIFLSGDTESSEAIAKVKNIDWAFVPPWLLVDAKERGVDIDAKMIGVYHLYPYEIEDAINEWKNVSHVIPFVKQGQSVTIE